MDSIKLKSPVDYSKNRSQFTKLNSLSIILTVTFVYTLITNFSIPILNTGLLIVFFIYALFARPAYAIALWCVCQVKK